MFTVSPVTSRWSVPRRPGDDLAGVDPGAVGEPNAPVAARARR